MIWVLGEWLFEGPCSPPVGTAEKVRMTSARFTRAVLRIGPDGPEFS